MDARKTALKLIKEHGDMYEAYAAVHNSLNATHPNEQTKEVKLQLEHLITLEAMQEYGWEKTDDGKWRYVTDGEFYRRLRADKKE